MAHNPRWRERSWATCTALLPDIEHGRLAYFADFAFYGCAVVALLAWLLMAHPPAAWPLLLALTLAGAAAWTLVEYLMHRWLLHRLEPFRSWHGMHHQRPLALLGTPTAVSVTLILLLVYAPVRAVLGHADAAALTLGFIAGYFAYAVLHHAVHHWRAQWDWLRGLKRWHARHHHLDGTRCFGVSSAFWDKMLGSGIEQTPGRATRPRPRG